MMEHGGGPAKVWGRGAILFPNRQELPMLMSVEIHWAPSPLLRMVIGDILKDYSRVLQEGPWGRSQLATPQ